MSVVVTVAAVGAVTVGAQVFAGLATAAAAALGMKVVQAAEAEEAARERAGLSAAEAERARAESEQLEVTIATEAALEAVVAERCSLRFADEKVEITVTRDIRGKVTVRAHGRGLPRAEVTERATRLLGLIRQQVAYREVVRKMKEHGLAVESEERQADGTVRVRIGRKR